MSKHVLSAFVFVAETLVHASVILESAESESPWMIATCLAGCCLTGAAILPHVCEALCFNGPPQIE